MKIPSATLAAMMITAFAAAGLRAQDVIVGEPGWFQTEGAPDVAPRTRHRLQVDYPRELRERGTGETGYVLVSRYLDARGHSRMLELRSPYPWFKQAVEESTEGWELFPAQRDGKPVDAWFWQAIIFNPPGADPSGPDATPRLVEVTPVILPAAMMMKLRDNTTAWGVVSLDAVGLPVKVTLEPGAGEKVLPYIEEALKAWRFVPARRGGRLVPSELRVAFLFYPPMAPVSARQTLPRPVKQVQPEYPYALRKAGITGRVQVAFVVNTHGEVADAFVERSNSPAFDEPALEAVLAWKFEPATVDGWPVSTRMRVPIVFSFDDGSGQEAVTVSAASRKAVERLPPEFRYDVPPKPQGVMIPVYPYALLRDDRTGKATAVFVVGKDGHVLQVATSQATEPEFGLALTAAVETYEFRPALRDGTPTQTVVRADQEFGTAAGEDLVTADDRALLRLEKKKPQSIVGASQLDGPLIPRSRRPPVFPVALRGKVDQGEAVVEFLVDEHGHARLPRIVRASDPAFGYAAVQAVSQWLFEPPKAGGRAAVARVTAPFAFELKPPVLGTGVGEPREDSTGK